MQSYILFGLCLLSIDICNSHGTYRLSGARHCYTSIKQNRHLALTPCNSLQEMYFVKHIETWHFMITGITAGLAFEVIEGFPGLGTLLERPGDIPTKTRKHFYSESQFPLYCSND